MRLELSRLAACDLDEIGAYGFENFGRVQSDEYLNGLFDAFDILLSNPRLGRKVSESGVRRHVYRMHLVYCRPEGEVLRIAHVRHGAKAPVDPDLFFAGL